MKHLDQRRNNAPLWMYLVMKIKSSAAKDNCIGTWNVRSMNQGKLDLTNQEMARINIDILRISELKCIEMGEFKSEDHYIYYCWQESHKKWNIPHNQQKSRKCSTWLQPQKRQNDLGLFPR